MFRSGRPLALPYFATLNIRVVDGESYPVADDHPSATPRSWDTTRRCTTWGRTPESVRVRGSRRQSMPSVPIGRSRRDDRGRPSSAGAGPPLRARRSSDGRRTSAAASRHRARPCVRTRIRRAGSPCDAPNRPADRLLLQSVGATSRKWTCAPRERRWRAGFFSS